jgi:hypothetical protein
MVEGRLTLVMERVGGETLRTWIERNKVPDPNARRRLAQDLLKALEYLEGKGITHKDLKPDNLLVRDGSLVVVDFSLAGMRDAAAYGGTALYSDPASATWSAGTDRYAAALCLFELYSGRHAFDGHPPEPGEVLDLREEDIEPPGLAPFFAKALQPSPAERFSSARPMHDAFLNALGADAQPSVTPPDARTVVASTPLGATGLSSRAINALLRGQVLTVGELLSLSADQVRSIHAIGSKTADDIIRFQNDLRARGIEPTAPAARPEPCLLPGLAGSPEPIDRLSVAEAVRDAFAGRGYPTIGSVARLTRTEALSVPGIGRGRLAQVVEALRRFAEQRPDQTGSHTLDRLWQRARAPHGPAAHRYRARRGPHGRSRDAG